MANLRWVLDTCCSSLECHVRHREGPSPGGAGLIILHPWARLGGCMQDPTVWAIMTAAWESGLFRTVARYNGRGAGRSAAKRCQGPCPDPEAADHAALAARLLTLEGAPDRLYVCGYSYGGCVAARALDILPRAAGYIAVGPPLGFWANLLLGGRGAWARLPASDVPKLALCGDRDNFVAWGALQAAVDEHNARRRRLCTPAAAGSVPGGGLPGDAGVSSSSGGGPGCCHGLMELQCVRGADHFYGERWDEVADLVVAWLGRVEAARGGAGAGARDGA